MIHNRHVAALIPIKDHSARVEGKNFRTFCGKPLYHHIVQTLHRTFAIDEILIDTDSPRVIGEARRLSPKVTVVERPEALRGDMVSVNRLIEHDLSLSRADIYVQTHATNPLLSAETIAEALGTFLGHAETHDSLFGVTRHQSRFYREDASAVNHDPANLIRTQDLPPLYEENSCLYVFTRESFAATGARIGKTPLLYSTPTLESVDIDDEMTWKIAEILGLHALARAA
jgi:CMP-N-acetylneuraminic acid synthetase